MKTMRSKIEPMKKVAGQFCFQTQDNFINTTGVEVWDIPPGWWFVGFGQAFSLFVSSQIEFELAKPNSRCDANFLFTEGGLAALYLNKEPQ